MENKIDNNAYFLYDFFDLKVYSIDKFMISNLTISPILFFSQKSFMRSLEKYSDVAQYAIPVVAGGYALFTNNCVEAVAMGLLGAFQKWEVNAIKKWIPRQRPQSYYPGKRSQKDKESFPSSHTGGAFLGAAFGCSLYGANVGTTTLVALSILVGFSRVLSKKHWLTDVVGGALIGAVHGITAAYSKQIYAFFPCLSY